VLVSARPEHYQLGLLNNMTMTVKEIELEIGRLELIKKQVLLVKGMVELLQKESLFLSDYAQSLSDCTQRAYNGIAPVFKPKKGD